ncbi:YhgE/Pip domain-containing protein [Enterococcus nangangensis]|uniref:YhgE/Pip domain-containing protein n=1 Tax=Enterococcus nangangensis TaxID=2559926 RepID=UPI0010F5179A|nr:YhgE/Pip domain-containing protein [Enterococcus nangangensis]
MTLVNQEFKLIARNKGLIGALVLVLIIPFFYSFCFLTSAWDPYGNTGKIPVAVVNLDEPAELNGTKIQAGADTVAKLKDDDQLKWIFVSEKEAQAGLKKNQYYSVITIPKDFSKNAATVLDDKPEKMQLQYETNGSLNYISEVITQVGVDKLNSQIREKVTTAFASELFDQIGTIGSQIKTAAAGATQINDGTKTLQSGVTQYTDGVTQVNTGVGTLFSNIPALTSGVNQLADGGNQIKDGLGQLQGKVPALTSGVTQLTDGGSQLKNGLQQLNDQVPTLSSGVNQLNAGINQLYAAVTTKNDQGQTLTTGITALKQGIEDLEYYTLEQRNGNPNMVDGVQQMAEKMSKLFDAVNKQSSLISAAFIPFDMPIGIDTNTEPYGYVTPEQLGIVSPDGKAYNLAHYEAAAKKETSKADASLTELGTASAPSAEVQSALTALESAVATTNDETAKQALADFKAQYETENTNENEKLAQFKTDYEAEKVAKDNEYATARGYLNFAKESLTNKGTDDQGDPTGLQVALQTFAEKLATLNTELSDADVSGHPTYANAVAQLQAGLEELDASVNNPDESQNLLAGITKLKDGMNQLAANVPALSDGVLQLYQGSVLESDGLNTLNSQTPALADGVNQLYHGAVQESDGLNTLNGQTPTLADGVTQLYDGTQQLVSNNQALNDGTQQLVAGSGQLAEGLNDGYKQIAATHLTNMTADMFAAPTETTQKQYSFVPNYGAALAPFVLALALFIAIVIFNFAYPMKRNDDDERSPLAWLLGKLAIGTGVALGMAVIEASLMLAVGLHVDHVLSFYGVTMLFAISAMYLTMFLNIVLGRLGIFVALGLLTMSGSGGLFPQETVSPLFTSLQKFLPMTYAINGYRQVITSGIAGSTVTLSVEVLVGIAVVSVALLILFSGLKDLRHKKQHLRGI